MLLRRLRVGCPCGPEVDVCKLWGSTCVGLGLGFRVWGLGFMHPSLEMLRGSNCCKPSCNPIMLQHIYPYNPYITHDIIVVSIFFSIIPI